MTADDLAGRLVRTGADVADIAEMLGDDVSEFPSLTAPTAERFLTEDEVGAAASGSTLGLEQQLLADAGQPALTVLAVGFTTSGKVQGVSLGDGNTVEVYASGADFNAGTVLYREFMSLGEPIAFTGLTNGAIITATEGFYGASEQVAGADESPMPLLSFGLSFDFSFFFGFRNFGSATVLNEGLVHVVNGPIPNVIKLTDGTGNTIDGQENIALDAWEYVELHGTGVREYVLEGTERMMACTNANMDANDFYDSRLIMPLSNDLISWPRSGDASAPFANTVFNYYTRDGASGSFTVNPGTPQPIDTLTGATDQDYEPNGATRTRIDGLGTWYSGADSSGLEASPAMPVSAMSQRIAQPLFIDDVGDGGNSGIAIASPYVGTARIYEWDDTAGVAVLQYTIALTRNGVTINNRDDQNHPTAGLIANEDSATATLVGDLGPGYIEADVPITVVVQNGSAAQGPNNTLRSQNGTTTSGMQDDDDETLMLGWTPSDICAEIKVGTDGLLYRREIGAGGTETWAVA